MNNSSYLVPDNLIAYKIKTLNGEPVYFLKPILDKLTLLINIPDEGDQLGLRSLLFILAKDEQSPHWESAGKNFYKGKKYANICKIIPPGSQDFITINIAPKDGKALKHFIKIEMNPNKLGFTGVKFFKQCLEEWFCDQIDVQDFLKSARISRYDIAFDFLNASFSQLLMTHDFGGKSLIFQGQKCLIETIYGGKKKTFPYSVYLYDKRKQLIDKGYPPKFGNIPHLRLEIRRPKGPAFEKLENCNNPFLKVKLFHKGMFLPSGKKHVWELFIDSCLIRGIESATAVLPREEKEIFSKGLIESSSKFWQPCDIWKHWPETIKDFSFFGMS